MALSETASRRVHRTVGIFRDVVGTFRAAHVPFLAASIAYAAFVSLIPLLVLLALIASAVGGEALASMIVDLTASYLSPAGQDLLVGTLQRARAQTGLSVLSALVLLWATLRLFRSLDLAFSLLYGTTEQTGIVHQLVDGVVVLTAMLVAFAGTVALAVLRALLPTIPYSGLGSTIALVAFLTVTLLPLYYVFPDRPVTVRDVLPGTVVAAVGWTALEVGFGLYVRFSSANELYGVVGGVILVITWLYFGALIVLLGATINVVLGGYHPADVDDVPV
jgi:membrane protein